MLLVSVSEPTGKASYIGFLKKNGYTFNMQHLQLKDAYIMLGGQYIPLIAGFAIFSI